VGGELLMRACAAGLAALVVAGCGSTQPAAAPSDARAALPSAQESRILVAARARLVRRCMAGRGFTVPAERQTAAYRRALMGTRTATLRLPEMTVRYRSNGCYAQAMGTLYGSVRSYQLLVAKRNVLAMSTGERAAAAALARPSALALERARRIVAG
jgi:hypothetical protein